MKPTDVIPKFDQYLKDKGLNFEAVVIGGTALAILKVISRETMDMDCLDPQILPAIANAAMEFRMKNPNLGLHEKWINNGPDSLLRDLPQNWRDRKNLIFEGKALKIYTLGRSDLLKTKLFAYCDRGDDYQDCLALKPTLQELNENLLWVSERDGNPMWPNHVQAQFLRLKKALGYE